jgi:hypothetical protein
MTIYGSDLSTFNASGVALDTTGSALTGLQVVAQACARRLMTAAGGHPGGDGIFGAPDYGLDLMSYAGKRITPVEKQRIGAAVASELARDERVQSARVVSFDQLTSASFRLRIEVVALTGRFDLVVAVPSLTVETLTQDRG